MRYFVLFFFFAVSFGLKVSYFDEPIKPNVLSLDAKKDSVKKITCKPNQIIFEYNKKVLSDVVVGKLVTGGATWKCGSGPFYRNITKIVKTEGMKQTVDTKAIDKTEFILPPYSNEVCQKLLKSSAMTKSEVAAKASLKESKNKITVALKEVASANKTNASTLKATGEKLNKEANTLTSSLNGVLNSFSQRANSKTKTTKKNCLMSELEAVTKKITALAASVKAFSGETTKAKTAVKTAAAKVIAKVTNSTKVDTKATNSTKSAYGTEGLEEVQKVMKQVSTALIRLREKDKVQYNRYADKNTKIVRELTAAGKSATLKQLQAIKKKAQDLLAEIEKAIVTFGAKEDYDLSPKDNVVVLNAVNVVNVVCSANKTTLNFRKNTKAKIKVGNILKGGKILGCLNEVNKADAFSRKVKKIISSTASQFVAETETIKLPGIIDAAIQKVNATASAILGSKTNSTIAAPAKTNSTQILNVKSVGNILTLQEASTLSVECQPKKLIVKLRFASKVETKKGDLIRNGNNVACLDSVTKTKIPFARKVVALSKVTPTSFEVETEETEPSLKGSLTFTTEQEGSVNTPKQKISFVVSITDNSLLGAKVKVALVGTKTSYSENVELNKSVKQTTITLSPPSTVTGKDVTIKISSGQNVLGTSKKTFTLNPLLAVTISGEGGSNADLSFYNNHNIALTYTPSIPTSKAKFNLVHFTSKQTFGISPTKKTISTASFLVEKFPTDAKNGKYYITVSDGTVTTQTVAFQILRSKSANNLFKFTSPSGGENYKKDQKMNIAWTSENHQTGGTVKLEVCSDKSIWPGDSCVTVTKSTPISSLKYVYTIAEKREDSDYYIKATFDCNPKCAEVKSEFFTMNFKNVFNFADPVLKGNEVTVTWTIANPAAKIIKSDELMKVYLVDDGSDKSKTFKEVKPSAKKISFNLGNGEMKNKRLSFVTDDGMFSNDYEYTKVISVPLEKELRLDIDFSFGIPCKKCPYKSVVSVTAKTGEKPKVEISAAQAIYCALCTLYNTDWKKLSDSLDDWAKFATDSTSQDLMKKLYTTKTPAEQASNFGKDLKKSLISNAGMTISCKDSYFSVKFKIQDVELSGLSLKSYKAEFLVDYNIKGSVKLSTGYSVKGQQFTDYIYDKVAQVTNPLGEVMGADRSCKGMRIPLIGPSLSLGGFSFPGSSKKFAVGLGLDIALKFTMKFAAELTFNYKLIGKGTYNYALTSSKYFDKKELVEKKERDLAFDNIQLKATIAVAVEAKAFINIFELINFSVTVELAKIEITATFRFPAFTKTSAADSVIGSYISPKCNAKHYLEVQVQFQVLSVSASFSVLKNSLFNASFKGFTLGVLRFCPV